MKGLLISLIVVLLVVLVYIDTLKTECNYEGFIGPVVEENSVADFQKEIDMTVGVLPPDTRLGLGLFTADTNIPAHLLSLKPSQPLNMLGAEPTEKCFSLNQEEDLKLGGSYMQRTNNYAHEYPDSCSAPRGELVRTFYASLPDGGTVGATIPKGLNLPPSTLKRNNNECPNHVPVLPLANREPLKSKTS
jgi:hypothetical protein